MRFGRAWTSWCLLWALVLGGWTPFAPTLPAGLQASMGAAAGTERAAAYSPSLQPASPLTLDRPVSASRPSFGALTRSQRLVADVPAARPRSPQFVTSASAPSSHGATLRDVVRTSLPGRAPPTSLLA